MSTGTVFDIKEFAVFDGPGIRTTVFMKGCPLRCQWCHNPEGLSPEPQLMVSAAACIRCGACERICQHPDHCIVCGACIPVCRLSLRKIAGRKWNAEELAERLKKDADVYQATGGGITFSGGEPLMQWNFVSDVIDRLGGIHTAVETSGFISDSIFKEAMHKADLMMMDWKISDPEKLRHYTGADQATILRHAEMLAAGDTPFILRMPVIPGVNDVPEHFETVADLMKDAKALIKIDILPYQRSAGAKYAMVGSVYSPEFEESTAPKYHTACFDAAGVPYQIFR